MSLDGRLVGVDDNDFPDFYQPLYEQILAQLSESGVKICGFRLSTADEEEFLQQIGHYSSLQLLRNFAAHLAAHGVPPAQSHEFVIGPELSQMYNGQRGFEPFAHLIDHSDADGYYLPIDFSQPIHFEAESPANGHTFKVDVGSCQALLRELDELNEYLRMPGDYGELGGFSELYELTHEGKFGAERWSWAVMRWLARESVDRNLLLELC
jgi:hypothetical protein